MWDWYSLRRMALIGVPGGGEGEQNNFGVFHSTHSFESTLLAGSLLAVVLGI